MDDAVSELADRLRREEQALEFLHLLGRHVVHDLRTPVTIIQGYGDLLRSGKLAMQTATAPLQAIVDQTARLLGILQDFALASGSHVPGRRVCPGTPLLPALAPLLPAAAPSDAQSPGDLPAVAVDAGLLHDIVDRLMALVTVMAGSQENLTVSAMPEAGRLALVVRHSPSIPLLPVALNALAGIPPQGPQARVPWLMRLIALQRLVASQGGVLSMREEAGTTVWHCALPIAGQECLAA